MASGDFKNLTRRTGSDKILRDKAFNIAKNPKCDRHQRKLASMVYIFFGKKSTSLADKSAYGRNIKNENISNKELPNKILVDQGSNFTIDQ